MALDPKKIKIPAVGESTTNQGVSIGGSKAKFPSGSGMRLPVKAPMTGK